MRSAAEESIVLVDALRVALDARAAGRWRIAGDRLEQFGFAAAPDMPVEVSRAFAEATRTVDLARTDLGIVRAAVGGEVAVSRIEDSPDDHGSGLWLRRFDASRSVAVPFDGWVVAVAVRDASRTDAEIAERVREAAGTWAGLG